MHYGIDSPGYDHLLYISFRALFLSLARLKFIFLNFSCRVVLKQQFKNIEKYNNLH